MNIIKNRSGQLLVELLVAIGLGFLLISGLLSGLMASRDGKAQEAQRLLAVPYLRQLDDAMREIRNRGWGGIAADGTYDPVISAGDWSLAAGVGNIGGFNQQAIISAVQRNQSGTIVPMGGTSDPATKQVESGISWILPVQNSASSTILFTRYRGNAEIIHTAQAQFNAGTSTQVLTTNAAGGEVQLEGWSAPAAVSAIALAHPGLSVIATGTRVYIGEAAGTGNEFIIYDMVNPAAPVLLGSLNTGSDINGIAIYGNYAFFALNNKTNELQVVNISNPAVPTSVALLNLPGDFSGAKSIAISADGTKLYIGKLADRVGPEFFVIDISNPAIPAALGSLELAASVNDLAVVGNFAYAATDNASAELRVIDVSNPAAPISAGIFNVTGNSAGLSIFATSTTVFLGTKNNNPGFLILNAADPAAISQIGAFNVGADVNGIFVSSNIAFLENNAVAKQLKIFGLYNYAAPVLFTDFPLRLNNGKMVFSGQYAYAIDNFNLSSILGNTATDFFSDGTFESSPINAGVPVAFNYFTWTSSVPAGAEVRFQVAANSDNATWNYVGPDGTPGTFYSAPGAVPLSIAANRYFRWKAYFSGAAAITPVLQDVTVNYSP